MRWLGRVVCSLFPDLFPNTVLFSQRGDRQSGQPLSIAALVGVIALAGISVRKRILKVSQYINLMRFDGEYFNHKRSCAAR